MVEIDDDLLGRIIEGEL